MVYVVVMARASRNDEALSPAVAAVATRRWLLVAAAVLAPIVLGALITVVLYVTRAQPVVARPVSAPAGDVEQHDGSLLIVLPKTSEQVRLPLGTSIEIVLTPGLGETVETANPDILTATANPPCRLKAICGFPGARVWTFRAIHAGVGYLRIIFGVRICQQDGCTTTPYVFKPIAVYARPQAT